MLKVLLIIPKYPCFSETFIQREIDAFRQYNVQIFIYALKHEKSYFEKTILDGSLLYRKEILILHIFKVFFHILKNKSNYFLYFYRFIFSYLNNPLYFLKLLRNSFYTFPLSLFIQKYNINIIHTHFADMATDIALLLNKLTGVPFTFSAHARDIFVDTRNLPIKCSTAVAVVACSQYAANYVKMLTGATNVKNIYHGLNLSDSVWRDIFKFRCKKFYKYYSHTEDFKIIAIGRLIQKKGYHVLINALKILRDNEIKFNCKIIGEGKQKRTLEKMISENHLEKNTYLFGASPFTSILEEFKTAHLLIVPSVIDKDGDSDNIPNVILEAQALGVPVLASDLPSIKEAVKHNKTGFLIPVDNHEKLAEEIKKIYSGVYNLRSVIIKAREQVEQKFDADKNTKKFIEIWNKNRT